MDPEMERRRLAYLAQSWEIIDRVGWMVQGVFPVEGDPDRWPFAYTAGLTRFERPELIVYGLGAEAAQTLLNQLADQAVRQGVVFRGWDFVDDAVQGGYRMLWVPVEDPTVQLTVACALFGEERVSALQLVFPDREHRWPWQDGSQVADMPLLGAVSEETRRAASD